MEERAVEWMEWIVHKVLFWESDNEKKGRIVRALHHAVSYGILTMVIVAHTLYPAFWLQTVLLVICGIIWIHHILTHGCVVSKVEQKLIQDTGSFLDPFLELFDIEATERSKQGILMLGSTCCIFMLTLGWFGRVHHYMIPVLKQAMSLAVSSVPRIHPPIPSL